MNRCNSTSTSITAAPAAPLSVPAGRPRDSNACRARASARSKNVTVNEPYLPGPFPAPPGDAGRHHHRGAGAGGRHAGVRHRRGVFRMITRVFYFVGIDKARFRRPVEPGDQLMLEATLERNLTGIWRLCDQSPRVGEAEVADRRMMLAPDADFDATPRNREREPLVIRPARVSSPQARARRRMSRSVRSRSSARRRDRRAHADRPARGDQRATRSIGADNKIFQFASIGEAPQD